MASMREKQLLKTYRSLLDKKMISMTELDQLMHQVNLVLMSMEDVTESRDKWKEKCLELKDQLREFKDVK